MAFDLLLPINTTKITISNFVQEVQFVGNAHALPTSPQTSLPVLLQYFRKAFLKSGKHPAILSRCGFKHVTMWFQAGLSERSL